MATSEMVSRPRRIFAPESRYKVLAACCACFALYHAARQMLLPALPLIKAELGLTYAQAGLVVAAYNIGYATTLFLSGYISDLLNRKRLIFGGMLWLAFTLFATTLSRSFVELTAIRILTGFAFGIYFAPAIGLISAYFSREERGTAVSLHTGVGAGSGRFLGPALAGLTLVAFGWKFLFYVAAAVAVVVALLFWKVVEEPPSEKKKALLPLGTLFSKVMANRFLIGLGICNGTFTACSTVLAAFLPLYLVNSLGMQVSFGGYAVALLNAVAIPMVPLFGYASDRIGRKPVATGVALLGAVGLLFLNRFTSFGPLVLVIAATGMFAGGSFPIIITYVVDVMPLEYRSPSIGYVNTFTTLTSSAMAILAGYVSDAFGVATVFPFLAAISTLGGLVILAIREPRTGAAPAVDKA